MLFFQPHRPPPRRRSLLLIAFFLSVLALPLAMAAPSTNAVLTNACDILAKTTDRENGVPVLIRGVITAAQPDAEWSGRFFVQDATAGIFVENVRTNLADDHQPMPGDYVEISGLSHPGGYAPIITLPAWRKLGTAPLPPAKPVPIEQLMAGSEDSQRVEISGIVRAFHVKGVVTLFEIASGGYRVVVNAPTLPAINPQTLIGARVRIRGTAATFYSGKMRHLITATLHVPVAADFQIEEIEPADPFAGPLIPLNSLAQYRHEQKITQRVHVRGVVSYQRVGEDLFLQDNTGAMQIKSQLHGRVSPGDVVEAVGFPSFEQFLPVLEDAVYRKVSGPPQPLLTTNVTIQDLEGGFRHADLITIRGRVIDRTVQLHWGNKQEAGPISQRTIFTMQHSNFVFSVEGPATIADSQTVSIPIGTLAEVTGVCVAKIIEDGKLQSLQVLLPSAQNIRILEKPSWWTPERLLLGLSALFAVFILAVTWSIKVSRRNATLKQLVSEKEEAQVGLQHANDRLEERVKERTEQLKFQITARKESELQFKAVLNERTRLAQELHDTLEQTLTGIALQMDTAAKFTGTDAARAGHHFNLARNLVTQSQSEVRCSVWDLRSRSPDEVDLPALLLQTSQRLTDDTSIQVAVHATGAVRPLPESIEENLLRIAQEALTNTIKHSRATQATITLDYHPQTVTLTIADNGVGFAVHQHAGPHEGHFGLLGINERTTRLRGQVKVTSEPGQGTRIEAIIPIAPTADVGLFNSQEGAQL